RPGDVVPEQHEHLAERTPVVDALADEPRDRHREHERPGDREKDGPEAEPTLDEHDQNHDKEAKPEAHVPRAPGQQGRRRPEPDGVDAIDLVVGADQHHQTRRQARKLPISGPLPDTAMPRAMRPTIRPTLRRATPALSPLPPIHRRMIAIPSRMSGITLSWN